MLPHNSGRTVVVKSHGLRADMFDRCQGKAILLIRNPYKALKSFLNHKSGGKHDGHARTLDDGQDGRKSNIQLMMEKQEYTEKIFVRDFQPGMFSSKRGWPTGKVSTLTG